MKLYKTKVVLRVSGITRGQFDQWIQKQIIIAEQPARRQGVAAKFSVRNMVQIKIIDQMSKSGMNLRIASDIAIRATDLLDDTLNPPEEFMKGRELCCAVAMDDPEKIDFFYLDEITPDLLNEILSSEVIILIRLNPLYSLVEKKLTECIE